VKPLASPIVQHELHWSVPLANQPIQDAHYLPARSARLHLEGQRFPRKDVNDAEQADCPLRGQRILQEIQRPLLVGPTAVVQVDGLTLVLTTKPTAPGDLQQLTSLGIEPAAQHIIVVKAAVRWRGGYGPIAKHAIHVDTPGLGSADLTRFPFRHIRRPVWPLDPATTWEPDARLDQADQASQPNEPGRAEQAAR
jgi:microcystin degradation protein MlrC